MKDQKFKIWTILTILWTTSIVIASLSSGSRLPKVGWIDIVGIDKIAHLIMYFGFYYFFFHALFKEWKWPKSIKNKHISTFLFGSFLGIGMEICQASLNTGRYFDTFDILANIIGLIVGYAVIYFKDCK